MPKLKRTSGSRFFARRKVISGLNSESSLVADSGKDADTQYILINFTDANLKLPSYQFMEGRRKSGRAESGGNEAKENRSPDNRLF